MAHAVQIEQSVVVLWLEQLLGRPMMRTIQLPSAPWYEPLEYVEYPVTSVEDCLQLPFCCVKEVKPDPVQTDLRQHPWQPLLHVAGNTLMLWLLHKVAASAPVCTCV